MPEEVGEMFLKVTTDLKKLDGDMKAINKRIADGTDTANKQLKKLDGAATLGSAVLKAEGLKGAIAAAAVPMQILAGDAEGLEQTLRRLPFGLGEVVGMTLDIANNLSGANEASERLTKNVADIAAIQAATAGLSGRTGEEDAALKRRRDIQRLGRSGGIEQQSFNGALLGGIGNRLAQVVGNQFGFSQVAGSLAGFDPSRVDLFSPKQQEAAIGGDRVQEMLGRLASVGSRDSVAPVVRELISTLRDNINALESAGPPAPVN
jgi:hypothetical protein